MSGSRFTKMNKKKPTKPSSNPQRTLFQSWGSRMSSGPSGSSKTSFGTDFSVEQLHSNPDYNNNAIDIDDDDNDEDELLMQALEQSTNLSREIGQTSFEPEENAAEIDLSLIPDLPGFDKYAGRKWIYPTNYPVREYQFNIVKSALFQNTLVALPTGLGKTFIAAVVMFNFYRWYPLGKIVFMAPTKPLVTQQIEACYNIMGIPQSDIAEMTGKMSPVARQKAWKEKRVIFLTPQILSNDLTRGTCEAAKIKCLVVDEAHRSLGNYAYCLVVKELVKINRDFRILALSATPGSNLTMVQDVIANLLISKIELRTDDSAEIKMYSFERKVEKIVVPLGEELKDVERQYLELLESVVDRLVKQRVLYKRNVKSLSKFLVLKCRDEFRQNPPQNLQPAQMGVIEGDFALALSLYHGYELLQLHGLRSFYQFLQSLVNGDKGYGRTRSELMKNGSFMNVFDFLTNKFGQRPSITFTQQTSQEKSEEYIIGHPKLEKLQEIVLEHFRKFQKDDGSTDSRVIIFSQYRNSVSDITEMLKRQQPLVKVISFMGQAVKKETKGFTQKEQLRVMKAFRDGNYNTLVSTCVGEEGLDIGDVDLIICFDTSKSPIRLVQRMGRTGRKRDGRIIMLVTEGKEDQIYKQSQYNKNSINKALQNGTKSLRYYQESPRMLPDCLVPQCHKMYITIKNQFENLESEKARIKNEKKSKKVVKRKKKTILDLLPRETSMDGRSSSISNSNSPNANMELLTVVENSDAENNLGRTSPPTYMRLSDDDELPDLLSQKDVCPPLKVAPEANNKKEKSRSKTGKKKKSVEKKTTKKKKTQNKKEEPFLIIPDDDDDDNASDFIDERETGGNLDGNGTIKFLFKSQLSQSKQEPSKSSKGLNFNEREDSGVSKNNPAETSLVPAAPSSEKISEMLDNLEIQDQQRIPPDLSSLVDAWDKEFTERIKPAGILLSSLRLVENEARSMHTQIRTMSPAECSSSCIIENDAQVLSSSLGIVEKEAISTQLHLQPISPAEPSSDSVTRNNELEEFLHLSPKKLYLTADDSEILDRSLPIINKRKRKLSSENADTEECKKSRSLRSPERERGAVGQSVSSNVPLISISPPQNCPSSESFSLNFDWHKEKLVCKEADASKLEEQRLKSDKREKNGGGLSAALNAPSPRKNCVVSTPSSPYLSPYKQNLPFADISSPRSAKFQSLEETSNKEVRSAPFGVEYRNKNQMSYKDISTKENSKLVDSCGDLFVDVSSPLNDATEAVNEKSKKKLPEAENPNPKSSAIHDSINSDKIVDEQAVCSEDDHPIFDLTTDMFSDDECDLFGTKSDHVNVRVDDGLSSSSATKVLSEINTRESMGSGVSVKSHSVPSKLSSLIISFVNTKVSTNSSKGDTNENAEDEELPVFDLGIDFDVFPPTPDLKNTQPLSSRFPQSNVGSSSPGSVQDNKDESKTGSHPRTENGSTTIEDVNLISSEEEEEEDLGGFRLVLPAVNVSGHLQYHSTPCPTKRNSSEELFTPCLKGNEKTSPSLLRENEDNSGSQSPFVSQGFDLKFDDLLDDVDGEAAAVETNSQKISDSTSPSIFPDNRTPSHNEKNIPPECDDKYESSEDILFVPKVRKKCAILDSPSLLDQTRSTSLTVAVNDTVDDEDSFCVRKKKKKSAVLISPLISNQSDSANNTVDDEDSFCVRKKKKKSAVLISPLISNQSDAANVTVDDEDSFCVRKKKKKSTVLISPLISNQSDDEENLEKEKEDADTPKALFQLSKEEKKKHSRGKRIRFVVDELETQDDFVTGDNVQKRFATKQRKNGDENGKLRKKSHPPGRRAEQLEARQFLDEEAVLSGSDDGLSDEEVDEGDDYEHSFINDFSQTQNMVDMKAVYLQSVVSPVVKHHAYKMRYDRPSVRDVYSCPVESDDDYEHDSFCVDSADSSLNETTFIDLSVPEEEETRETNVGRKSKKQRIIRPESSSSEDEPVEIEGTLQSSTDTHTTRISENKEQTKGDVLNDKRNEPIHIRDSESEDECENLDPLVIFAASKEISGAQDIISDLRLKHRLNVVVTKLEACDYIVSLRTAVERKVMTDFANGANNKKLVKRLQDMCENFERPCLIVEKNPQKGSEGKNVSRPVPQTKYLETLLTQLSLSSIRLLFSENKNETCTLLASLCCQENVKGQAICKNQVLSDSQQQKLKFYMALPRVNYALALNLCQNFKTIKEFLESSVTLIVTRSKMSSERASYIHKFIRQKFR